MIQVIAAVAGGVVLTGALFLGVTYGALTSFLAAGPHDLPELAGEDF